MKAVKKVLIELNRRMARPLVDVVQGDTGILLDVIIKDFVIPSGTKATLYAVKPSGKYVYQTDGLEVRDDRVRIPINNQAIVEVGKVPMQVTLQNDNDIVTTFDIVLNVERNLSYFDAEESMNYINPLEQKLQECIEDIDEFKDNVLEEIATSGGVTDERINGVVDTYIRTNPDVFDGYARTEDIPTALRNPYKLKFTGSSTKEYDGSTQVIVDIPKAVSSDEIKLLINSSINEKNLASKNEIPTSLKNPYSITFTGAERGKVYDGSKPISINIPENTGGDVDLSNYPTISEVEAMIPRIPTSLKNPYKLIFNGAINAEYNGSTQVDIEIPEYLTKFLVYDGKLCMAVDD